MGGVDVRRFRAEPGPAPIRCGQCERATRLENPLQFRQSRFRRAGELVLCIDDEYAPHRALVPVRCEADVYAPGALLARADVEFLEQSNEVFGPMSWGKPGARP